MNKKYLFLIIIILFSCLQLVAAPTFTISGIVKEQASLKPIAGANIYINGTTFGVVSDPDGYFSLSGLPAGAYELFVNYMISMT